MNYLLPISMLVFIVGVVCGVAFCGIGSTRCAQAEIAADQPLWWRQAKEAARHNRAAEVAAAVDHLRKQDEMKRRTAV